MVVYSNKYGIDSFTRRHKNYCEKHGLDPDTVDIDELNAMMRESYLIRCRDDNKKYYKEHAEEIKEKYSEDKKRYREENHAEILERRKAYARKRIRCQCGSKVLRNNLSRHVQSNRHKEAEGIL